MFRVLEVRSDGGLSDSQAKTFEHYDAVAATTIADDEDAIEEEAIITGVLHPKTTATSSIIT